jgi:hypothetical protein
MSCEIENTKINTVEELEQMLKEAKKGIARVDKTYVQYENPGHLFSYNIDFEEFLENIDYILSREYNERSL